MRKKYNVIFVHLAIFAQLPPSHVCQFSVYTIEVPPTHLPQNLYLLVYNSKKLTTQMYRQMLIIPIMEDPQPGRMVPNQKGGQNLVDQNNIVYRKARFSPDKSKQFFKCVKCNLLKCKASVWIQVGTLIVNNTAMQEHNHRYGTH